jgi:hypothetical protein
MEKIRIRGEVAVFFLYSNTGRKRQAGADEKVRKPRSVIFLNRYFIMENRKTLPFFS